MVSTLVIIKPDAVHRHIEILERFRDKFQIVRQKTFWPSLALVMTHYAEHKGKDFFEPLCQFMTSGLVTVLELQSEAKDIVLQVRTMLGKVGEKGTLRGDFGTSTQHNAVHASDSDESAQREIQLWFPEFHKLASDCEFGRLETLYQKDNGTFVYVAGRFEDTISETEAKEFDEKQPEGCRPFTHNEWLESSTRWCGKDLKLFADQYSDYNPVGKFILMYVKQHCHGLKRIQYGMPQK
jgi:nucleoside-diphosphate kinase